MMCLRLRRPAQLTPTIALALAVICFLFGARCLSPVVFSDSNGDERMGAAAMAAMRSTTKSMLRFAPAIDPSPRDPVELLDIQNSTLGFQKIYAVSMPSRTDKRDALALSAYVSGLEIEFVDGPNGSQISTKAAPEKWDWNEPPGTLGCWRGHMDVYQKMLREGIQTALILEDDADWDVMIKAQMTEFARGTRHLQRSTGRTHSPYGDGWDVLVTGHCGLQNFDWLDQEYWLTRRDPTAPHPSELKFWRKPNLNVSVLREDHTRLVLSPHKFTCLGSYAMSIAGAARLIYDQSILPNGREIDIALSTFCRRRPYSEYGCLAAYPMITGIYRPAGSRARDSDRKELGASQIREVPVAENLMYSVRLNLPTLLRGEGTVKAQFPDTAMLKEIDAATLRLPKGGPASVMASEYIRDEPGLGQAQEAVMDD